MCSTRSRASPSRISSRPQPRSGRARAPRPNRGLQYLNPSLSTTRRLFGELASDKQLLRRFVTDSAEFMSVVGERRQDLSGVVPNLNTITRAIANEKGVAARGDRPRKDLRPLLSEYAFKGLTAAGPRLQRGSIEYWEPVYRSASLVNDATLGTRPGNLRKVVGGQQKTPAALDDNEDAVQGTITNLDVTANALAREDEAAIPALNRLRALGTIESWDCEPNGGEQSKPEEDDPPCFVEPDSLFDGNKFPTLQRGETSRVRAPRSNEPCNDPSNPPGRGSLRAGCGTLNGSPYRGRQ